jgi:phage head maturation protease
VWTITRSTWIDLSEDGKGLRAKGKLILETVKGAETYALMRAGALDGQARCCPTTRQAVCQRQKVGVV